MNGAEDGWVRRTVVQQNDRGREGKRSGRNLQEKHDNDGEPDPRPVGLVRRRCGGRCQGDVWSEGVGEWEEGEEVLVGFGSAETAVDGWVDGELEKHTDDAEDGGCEADALRQHTEATGEDEGEFLSRTGGIFGVVPRGGEEEEPEIVEGAGDVSSC